MGLCDAMQPVHASPRKFAYAGGRRPAIHGPASAVGRCDSGELSPLSVLPLSVS
jgi:hypothetical protein